MSACREWRVALITDELTGAVIADFTGRLPQDRPVAVSGETMEFAWGEDGMCRMTVTGSGGADE